MTLVTASRRVDGRRDTTTVFETLASSCGSMLLESADIQSKDSLQSLVVLTSALRVTCHADKVTAVALTPVGVTLLDKLRRQFSHRLIETEPGRGEGEDACASFRFPPSQAQNERERLQAESTAAILRALQRDATYGDDLLPFVAGGFAFDYLAGFEELPAVEQGPNTYPDYEFLVAQELLHVDHRSATSRLHAVGRDAAEVESRLDELTASIDGCLEAPRQEPTTSAGPVPVVRAVTNCNDAEYRGIVKLLQEHVSCGDIYQVVPARAFTLPCPEPLTAYRVLRETNPSPYMFYIRGTDYELMGASPESNLTYDAASRQIQLYPIAGTRPRGLNPDGTINHEVEVRNELELRTDAKELAEHTMLVDLARNDAARICVPGTRRVSELMTVDRYSRVMHLVSRVTGILDNGLDALDAYRACMNMGTLSGAPKLKATELLRKAEGTRRGSYGGAVGYLRGDGSMDNCIVIRSAFIRGGQAVVQAGAGVVRDSVPQAEADETVHKAHAVLEAIAVSQQARLEIVR